MHLTRRRLLLLSAAALFLLAALAAFGTHASAAAVDIDFSLKDTDATCRQWTDGQTAFWNLSLIMNGTDTTSITTRTWVWIDDTGAPAMRGNSWVTILTASGGALNPPAYDSTNSNELAIGSGTYAPVDGTLKVLLYSAVRSGNPAPPTNVTLQLTPNADSENKDHRFNITATTDRTGVPVVTRKVPLCVHVPPKPRFDMGNFTDILHSPAEAEITVSFWLKNTGNTQDYYFCNVSVPREDWTANFTQGVNKVGSDNITNLINISQNLTIRVKVFVPREALARENSTVSLNCTSFKAITMGLNLFVYPPYTRIEVDQYYFVAGRIVGDSTKPGVPGDQLRFDFVVQNFGNGPDTGGAVIAVGNISWDALTSPNLFDLAAHNVSGWEQPAQFLVTIPADTLILTYDFTIEVSSTVNITTPVTQLRFHVQVKQVYVPLISPVAAKTGELEDEVVFNFTIKNGGNGLDSLLIEYFNVSYWRVFLSPPVGKVLLQVKEERAFQATVIVPREITRAQVGIYNHTVRITSEYAQLDLQVNIFVEVNLSVIILPRISCAIDPTVTVTELNPFHFPGNIATANFVLRVSNTGNGGDSVTMTAQAPAGFNVTLGPSHLQLNLLETKFVLVTIVAPPALGSGEYKITVVGRSDFSSTANCTSEYRLHTFHLDGSLDPTVQSFIQNPEAPTDEITSPVSVGVVSQIEGYFVKFRVRFVNVGDRAIAAGSASVIVYDNLECTRVPIGAANDTCGSRVVFNWTNPNNVITGVGGTAFVEFVYFAPEYLCFDEDVCHRTVPPPPANAHHVRFVLSLADESQTTNNAVEVVVEVLPRGLFAPDAPTAAFPILPVGAAAGTMGLVGFAYWYRFVRKPKVDEDLYASIYGAQGAGVPESQSVAQYFATQQGDVQAPQVPKEYQGMTDEQLEEARRLYGENYGR